MDTNVPTYRIKNILRGIILLCLVVLIGTAGYVLIEGWDFLDGLYMTVITITTVGFKEVRDVSPGGKLFTLFLIFTGIGIMAYTLGLVAQVMVEFQVRSILGRRKLGLKLKSIKNHYIVCGYGRIGRIIAHELKSHRIPLLVIDQNPESQEALESHDIPYIIGDATSEEVLLEAGVERARGLVSVVLSDADNVFITMTARDLNPELYIVTRAEEEQSEKKLRRAGASRVVLPYLIGGREMAHTILKPAVTDFLELTVHDKSIELKMEELNVGERSVLDGIKLVDSGIRKDMNVIIVAIRKKNAEMVFNPSSQTSIEAGDTLIALGNTSELNRLSGILAGK